MHRSHIPFIDIDENMQVYDTIMAVLKSAKNGSDGFEEVETIVLDSVWKLSDLLLEEIVDLKGKTGTKPQFEDWGNLLTKMTKICSTLISLPYHVIVTSGEAVKQDEMDEDESIVTFNFSGSFRNRLPYMFDFNLYMKAQKRGKDVIYVANTLEENKRTAKSRVSMPRQIVDPSFEKIREFVEVGLRNKEQ